MTSLYDPATDNASTMTFGQRRYPTIVLFGDSITEQSELTFAAILRQEYVRKADIINRGFSGYTSKLALDILSKFFPSPAQTDVPFMTLFFGANDACLPGVPQHVPVQEYMECLKALVQHPCLQRHPTKVVLIVPAPVDEYQMNDGQRTAVNTKRYADACREVGNELGLPLVDLWSVFAKQAGWDGGSKLVGSRDCPKNPVLAELLSDGLHFTPQAYTILFRELMTVIRSDLPAETPERMPMVFPAWLDMLVANGKS